MAGVIFTLIKSRTKASSLVEVITAIIIISAVFSLSILIYVNVQRAGFSEQRIKAEMRLSEILNDSTIADIELKYDDMIITRYTSEPEIHRELLLVSAEARTLDGKVLARQKRIIYDDK